MENSNNSSPNLISFSPLQIRGSALKKTPVHISPLGPPRRVLKIDQENDVSFSNNNNNYSSKYFIYGRWFYDECTTRRRIACIHRDKQTQEKLKSFRKTFKDYANDSPPSSRKSYNAYGQVVTRSKLPLYLYVLCVSHKFYYFYFTGVKKRSARCVSCICYARRFQQQRVSNHLISYYFVTSRTCGCSFSSN